MASTTDCLSASEGSIPFIPAKSLNFGNVIQPDRIPDF